MNIKKWDTYHCLGMLPISIVYFVTGWLPILLVFAIFSFLFLWISFWHKFNPAFPGGSVANWITLIRLAGLILVGLFMNEIVNSWIAVILGVLILLDGLDGFLARKLQQESEFGAYFDMETDALFVCIISVIVYHKGIAGNWILVPGFTRYFYVALISLFKINNNEKSTKIGPAIAVIMFLSLTTAFVLPKKICVPILLLSTALLLISFGHSFILAWISRHKT